MKDTGYLELTELQQRIKEGLQSLFPGKVWVKAEIGQYSPRSNGHCYLSLSQSEGGRLVAESRAMIWKWNFPQIATFFEKTAGESLRAGITVLVRCQVNYSEVYGISLFIDAIDPSFTVGERALEKKRTIERLTSGGYMEMQKELALPRLPYHLAVISSRTAAGYGDFCRHLEENEFGYRFDIRLFEAMMQGNDAPDSISEALAEICDAGGFDAVLILRGGGSDSDLSCFDDYSLAVAIATCPLPVITAIGHDRDMHVADMVASRYVKTPTALAALFIDIYAAEDELLTAIGTRIRLGVSEKFAATARLLDSACTRLRLRLDGRLNAEIRRVDTALSAVKTSLTGRLGTDVRRLDAAVSHIRIPALSCHGAAVSKIALMEAIIKASDPRTILERGYVLVTGKDNKILKTVDKVSIGDRIGVRFTDGSVTARVDKVISDQYEKTKINTA